MLKKGASMLKKSLALGIAGGIAYKFLKRNYYIDGNPIENQKSIPPHLKSYIIQKVSEDLRINKSLDLENNFFTFNTHFKESEGKRDYFTQDEIIFLKESKAKEIIEATYNIHSMCLQLVDEVVKDEKLLDLFQIPVNVRPLVRDSWEKRETDFLGRFDFLIDRKGNVKLLEYNADTPTLLVESGRVQSLVYENIKKEELKKKIFEEEKQKFIENLIKGAAAEKSANVKATDFSEPVIDLVNNAQAQVDDNAESFDTDEHTLSPNDHRNFMCGKFYSKGRTFFKNYDAIDQLFQLIEDNVYRNIN